MMTVAHTADVDPASLDLAQALLRGVFGETWTDHDWDHALGGVHVMVWEGSHLVGHGSVVQRRLLHGGRALRAGYVEGMGVRADRRRRGYGGSILQALERVIRAAYELGALAATDAARGFYTARGWQPWRGPLSVLTPGGLEPSPDAQGCVHVLPLARPLDPSRALACDWRDGDPW